MGTCCGIQLWARAALTPIYAIVKRFQTSCVMLPRASSVRRDRRTMGGVANPDRLSGVDASFLHLEDGGVHMHVGSCMVFEGPAPAYDEFVAQPRAAAAPRPPLPAEARLPAARPGPPGVGRRPALPPRLPRPPHRAPGARRRGRAAAPGRPRALPAAGPRQAAVGALAGRRGRRGPLRARREEPPLPGGRDLRRRPREGAVRPRARPPEPSGRCRSGSRVPSRAARPRCWPTRWPSGRGSRSAAARAGGGALHPPGPRGRRSGPSRGSARWPRPGSAPRRPARSTCRSARTAASSGCRPTSTSSGRSRPRSAGRSTTSCSPWSPGALRAHWLAHGRPVGGSSCARWSRCRCAPTRSAGPSATASRSVWAPLPLHRRTRWRASASSTARWRASRSRARRSAPRC